MDDSFFGKKRIKVRRTTGGHAEAYMRPLKVKEIPQFLRIAEISEGIDIDAQIQVTNELIDFIAQTVDRELDPEWSVNSVIDEFFNYNFADDGKEINPADKEKMGRKIDIENILSIAFDFLISQGHGFSEIMEYTLPQFHIFLEKAMARVFGVSKAKPVNPLKTFSHLGIPIRKK